jgi:DNA ligase D-like protein (predicted ligase)
MRKRSAVESQTLQWVAPMQAFAVQQFPEGGDWSYEVKLDGYRALAAKDSTGVTLWSRRAHVITQQFATIARACEQLPPDTLVDGELIALDAEGYVSFDLLQRHGGEAHTLLFHVFDLLTVHGKNMMRAPLENRRKTLAEIVSAVKRKAPALCFSETIDGRPADLLRVVRDFHFEGVVAKRKDSPYEPGKCTGAWLKYKLNQRREFVIGGYTQGKPFDALMVGAYKENRLVYVSKVRAGLVPHIRTDLAKRFSGLQTDVCPFANLPQGNGTRSAPTRDQIENCVWLRPELVAQIEFTGSTPEGRLRHAIFRGIGRAKSGGARRP